MQRQRLEADKAHSRNSIQWWTREIEQLHTRIAEARLRIAETDDDLSLIDALAHAVGLRDDATTLMWAVIVEAADAGVSQTDLHHETGIARSTLRRQLDSRAHDEIRALIAQGRVEDSPNAPSPPATPDPDRVLERCKARRGEADRCRLLAGHHARDNIGHQYLPMPQPSAEGHTGRTAPCVVDPDAAFDHPGPHVWDCSCSATGIEVHKGVADRAMLNHQAAGHYTAAA